MSTSPKNVTMAFQNPHPGGDFYIYSPTLWGPEPFLIRDSFDPPYDTRGRGFQVFVQIPEPSTLVLATLAAAMLRLPMPPSAKPIILSKAKNREPRESCLLRESPRSPPRWYAATHLAMRTCVVAWRSSHDILC
jgi:hypothetical protein